MSVAVLMSPATGRTKLFLYPVFLNNFFPLATTGLTIPVADKLVLPVSYPYRFPFYDGSGKLDSGRIQNPLKGTLGQFHVFS
jgi:hypothetical protein